MPSVSAILLESVSAPTGSGSGSGSATETGTAAKGDGWYGYADGNHTVSWNIIDFIGEIYIQGSLVEDPTDDDWGEIMSVITTTETTDTAFANFVGNYVWIRAEATLTDGSIINIQYNH